MMKDPDGRSRGFAFVEYGDPNHALSAIRNMNGLELNGRTLRVNYSNNSHLEGLAAKLGLDMSRDKLNEQANQMKVRGSDERSDELTTQFLAPLACLSDIAVPTLRHVLLSTHSKPLRSSLRSSPTLIAGRRSRA